MNYFHCLGLGHETLVCAVCLSIFLWISHNQHWMCPPFAWRTAAHLRRISIIRLSMVAGGISSYSSWWAKWSCSLFAESGCRRRAAWSRTSKTNPLNMLAFSSFWNCLDMRAAWGLALWGWKIVLFQRRKGSTIRHSISWWAAFRLPTMAYSCVWCTWDIIAQFSTPPPPYATMRRTVTSASHSPVQCYTRRRPSALWSWKCYFTGEGIPPSC